MTHLSRARAEHKKAQQLAELPSLRHAGPEVLFVGRFTGSVLGNALAFTNGAVPGWSPNRKLSTSAVTSVNSLLSHVFANPRMKGRQAYWGQEIMSRVIRPTATQAGNRQTHWVAHLPAHVFDPSAGKQGGHQSHAGTAQARLQPGHYGHV